MKNLFDKPLKFYIWYSLIILTLSVPCYFWIVDTIWSEELDENNEIIAHRAKYELEKVDYKIHNADSLISFWNIIQPNAKIEPLTSNNYTKKDSVYSIYKSFAYTDFKDLDRFRVLETTVKINNKPYLLVVESNVEEVYEIVLAIAFVTLVFFLLLLAGFLYYNRKMNQKLWSPFKDTLQKLKDFRLEEDKPISLKSTDILEFEELNASLIKLTTKDLEVYKIQKEFTENASHELQTPLAIIQAKVDLILQSNNLDQEILALIENTQTALSRAIRINKNLLLLAKIENRQFQERENINLLEEISTTLELLHYEIEKKNLNISVDVNKNLNLHINPILLTSLIQNLLVNAIRYTNFNGEINISSSNEGMTFSNSGTASLNQQKVFKRFTNLKENQSTTGIGLAIVKEICSHNKWLVSYQFKEYMHHFTIKF